LPQIWTDARYEAVEEARRVQLFREFKEVLRGAAACEAPAAQEPPPARQAQAAVLAPQPSQAAPVQVGPALPLCHTSLACQ
jgi:hypothetical protein